MISLAELRLQNDLIDLKQCKMTTSETKTLYSDIFKDEKNKIFFIHVSIQLKFSSKPQFSYLVL